MKSLLGNLTLVFAWVVSGLVTGAALILMTGFIPFIVPGLIVGICGAIFHTIATRFIRWRSWWFSAIVITILSIFVTIIFIPDSRHWVIARLILAYYLGFTFFFCLMMHLVKKYRRLSEE